jgi:ankyrin repeat protein
MAKDIFNQAAANDNGPNPDRELLRAAEFGALDKVKFWLKLGANIDARHTNNDTPLIIAVREGHEEVVKYLLSRKGAQADTRLQNNAGESALHVAARDGVTKMALLLMKSGAPLGVQDEPGATPAFYAAQTGNDALIDALAAAAADLNQPNPKKTTPLIQAVKFIQMAAVGALLQHRVDLDAQDEHGMTALMYAGMLDNNLMVQALISHGAKLGITNLDAKTAPDLAREKGHGHLAAAMEKAVERLNEERYGVFHRGTDRSIPAMRPLTLRPQGEKP